MLSGSVVRRFPVRAWDGAMAARNDLRLNAKDLIAVAGDLGAQGRVFTDNEVRQLLRAAIELAETQVAFAKRHGLDPHAPQSGLKRKKPGQWLTAEVSRTSQSIHARAGRRSGQNRRSALPCPCVTARRGLIRDRLPLQHDPEKWTLGSRVREALPTVSSFVRRAKPGRKRSFKQ